MKLKCKLLLVAGFALSIVFTGKDLKAQHNHNHGHGHNHPHPHVKKKVIRNQKAKAAHNRKVAHKVAHRNNKGGAIKVIRRTNYVITKAHGVVKKNKVYTGDLSRAFHHQRHAKRLLKTNKSHRAIHHSRLARKYAFMAIKSNKGTADKAYQFNDEENAMAGEAVTDAELQKELKDSDPKITFDDAAISDKEMTELEVLDTDPSDYKGE